MFLFGGIHLIESMLWVSIESITVHVIPKTHYTVGKGRQLERNKTKNVPQAKTAPASAEGGFCLPVCPRGDDARGLTTTHIFIFDK